MYSEYSFKILNLLYDNIDYHERLNMLIDIGNEIYKLHGNKGLHIVLDILFQNNQEYSNDYTSSISQLEKLWNDEFAIYNF